MRAIQPFVVARDGDMRFSDGGQVVRSAVKREAVDASERQTAPPASLTPTERIVARLLPSAGDMVFVCVLLGGLLYYQGLALGRDGDAGWTLRLGAITLSQGLPRTEPLLSTMRNQPTVQWEWLAQVAYALAYRLGGLNGAVALAALLIAFTLASLYAILRRHGASLLLAVALTLTAAALVSLIWSARAQLFSLPLTLWWSEWLWRYWRDGVRRRLWLFPLATALWANLHAGYLGGFALLGAATLLAWISPLLPHRVNASQKADPRMMTLALAGSLLATLCTPWGVALPLHIVAFLRNPLIPLYTQEYQSPDFHQFGPRIFLALLVALVAVWLWSQRGSRQGPELLALLIGGMWSVLALIYVRFVPFWPLVALPYMVDALAQPLQTAALSDSMLEERHAAPRIMGIASKGFTKVRAFSQRLDATDRLIGRGLWSALALVVVVLLLVNNGRLPGAHQPLLHAEFDAHVFPVAAVARLKASALPQGRGFNTYEWGGYLDQALPEYAVFIDSRSDVYSPAFLRDYISIITVQPGWQKLLDQYQIAWALLPDGQPLTQLLALTHGWRCQLEDDQGVATLCLRSPPDQQNSVSG